MKNYFYLLIALLFVSCDTSNSDKSGSSSQQELDKLKQENARLKNEVDSRDSSLNASIQILNEIEDNLSLIRQKESAINMSRNNDPELELDQKDRIIEEIQTINSLMEENKNKLNNLRSKMKKADMKIGELEKMIDNLLAKISDQDEVIASLREELTKYDIAMDELTASLNETVAVVEEKEAELNTAYYVSGSTKELKEQGIITKEGGFIGIGKIMKLREDFNKDYFTQLDITKTSEIILGGKEIEILTTHPKGSYKITGDKVKEKLVITDATNFWSVSKYLVVVVD
jgi:DNA repair exonuclease SbcCD ATPase subunit